MSKNLKIGDFDLFLSDVVLVHKCQFFYNDKNCDYRAGRKVSGVVYCISGCAEYDFGSRRIRLDAGGLIFLPASSSYVVTGISKEPFKHITANFVMTPVTGAEKTAATAFSEILNLRLFHVTGKENAAVFKELAERLLAVWQAKNTGYGVLAKSVLYEILYTYFTDAGRVNSSDRDYSKILPAKNILDSRCDSNISVAELAEACKLSQTHFRRLFVKLFGCSPSDYRLNKRILKAKDLLLSGEYSVSDTAREVGFDDASYFSRLFHQRTGYSPSEFLKQDTQMNL